MTESGNPSQPTNVNEYTSSHIQVFEGHEAVRRRPGMYIGSAGEHGLHQLVYEVVSYATDEHLAGHADAIDVTITPEGGIRVADNGRGLPVEVEEPTGKSAVELELTELSFGSKPHTGYGVSGGLSGLGLCVVNALSSRLTVEVHRDGHRWTQKYEKGTPVTPLTRNEETSEHGTTITFLPDADIFETTRYSFATLSERLQELAFLNGGLAVSLTDERPERPVRYHHTDGLRDYVARLNPYPRVSSTPPPSPLSRRTRTRRSSCRSPCSGTPGPRESSAPSRTAPAPARAVLTKRAFVPLSQMSSTTTLAGSGMCPRTTRTSRPRPSTRA